MTRYTAFIIATLIDYVWMTLCLGTCAYAVFWLGHSGWWFVLAVFLCCTDPGGKVAALKSEGKSHA